jgi:hypothetical protein
MFDGTCQFHLITCTMLVDKRGSNYRALGLVALAAIKPTLHCVENNPVPTICLIYSIAVPISFPRVILVQRLKVPHSAWFPQLRQCLVSSAVRPTAGRPRRPEAAPRSSSCCYCGGIDSRKQLVRSVRTMRTDEQRHKSRERHHAQARTTGKQAASQETTRSR